MASYLSNRMTTRVIPQTEPLDERQTKNKAGGYTYEVDKWGRLNRFLILGSEDGTYYASEKDLTKENIDSVKACITENGPRVVDVVVDVSLKGRAAKQDPTLYVLALCAAATSQDTRQAAYAVITKVCRTSTMLFMFVDFVNNLRGWSRGLRTAVAKWYETQTPQNLAYQMTKYQSRENWTHKDVLRLAHPSTPTTQHAQLYNWGVGKFTDWNAENTELATYMSAFYNLQQTRDPQTAADLIMQHNLPMETVPTELRMHAAVWSALLENLPMTALVRNLATMTRVGVVAPHSAGLDKVRTQLRNVEAVERSRLHPITVLAAFKTYESGRGVRGTNTWNPVAGVLDSLNDAFYTSFGNVQPTKSRILVGLDVSGSMAHTLVNGIPNLQCREAAAAMSLVLHKMDEDTVYVAFDTTAYPLTISPKLRFDGVYKLLCSTGGGGTDCAIPMIYAREKKIPVDTFVLFTDSQSWAGREHPKTALDKYRNQVGIDTRLIVVAMESTSASVGDPNDSRILCVSGFDTATPSIISSFIDGDI